MIDIQVLHACNALLSSQDQTKATEEHLDAFSSLLLRNVERKNIARQLVSDMVMNLHSKILDGGGLKAFQSHVTLSNCLQLLDFLLGKAQFQGALQNGGKLLACGIIAGTYSIFVPQSKVISLPFCSWLSDYSGHPKNVIRAQAESILMSVLSITSDS